MANSYVAPNFNIDTSCNIADLVTLKGSNIAGTDLIYVYLGAVLTVEQSFSVLKIILGNTSGGAATAGGRYGAIIWNAGVTCTWTGILALYGSGVQSTPTSADASSKSCYQTVNGMNASPVIWTNSVGSNNINNKYLSNMVYGHVNGTGYLQINFYYSTLVFILVGGSSKCNQGSKCLHYRFGIAGASNTSLFPIAQNIDFNHDLRFSTIDRGTSGISVWLISASSIPLVSGGSVDISGFYSPVTSGVPFFTPYIINSSVYGPRHVISFADNRPTEIIPTGLALSDTGYGKTLGCTITNIASYVDTDEFDLALNNGTIVACFSKADYVANGNQGFTWPVLTDGISYQLKIRATSDNATYSDWSSLSTGATPNHTSYDFPAPANVLTGYTTNGQAGTFNEASRNTDPGIANVLLATNYKILNVSKIGTFDEASRNTDPLIANVALGINYKILGASLIGTNPGGGGSTLGKGFRAGQSRGPFVNG